MSDRVFAVVGEHCKYSSSFSVEGFVTYSDVTVSNWLVPCLLKRIALGVDTTRVHNASGSWVYIYQYPVLRSVAPDSDEVLRYDDASCEMSYAFPESNCGMVPCLLTEKRIALGTDYYVNNTTFGYGECHLRSINGTLGAVVRGDTDYVSNVVSSFSRVGPTYEQTPLLVPCLVI